MSTRLNKSDQKHLHTPAWGALGAVITLIFLSGCGANNYVDTSRGSSTLGSREAIDNFDTSPSSASSALAVCNQFAGGEFEGKVQVFVDSNNQVHNNTLRVHIDKLPSGFSGSTKKLQFYSWFADFNGADLDENPIQFYIEDALTALPVSGVRTELSGTDMGELSRLHLGADLTPEEFISRVNIVLTNVSLSHDAMKLTFYDHSTLVSESNFLIPAFAADPTVYAEDHPAVLTTLHPNFTLMGQLSHSLEYFERTKTFCF